MRWLLGFLTTLTKKSEKNDSVEKHREICRFFPDFPQFVAELPAAHVSNVCTGPQVICRTSHTLTCAEPYIYLPECVIFRHVKQVIEHDSTKGWVRYTGEHYGSAVSYTQTTRPLNW